MTAPKGKPDSRELIKKFFEKRYPADIEKRFHLWLLDSTAWDEKDEALEGMWEATAHGSVKQAKGSLQEVRKKLGFPAATVKPLKRRLALRIAAVIIPFMVIAGGYMLWNNRPAGQDALQVSYLEAPAGTRVVLPDNSVVEVKEGILFYPSQFRGYERRVKFDGSAYFTVTSDASQPFIVEGTVLSVRVTGTQFMVSTDAELTVSTVSLVEGAVEVLIEGLAPIALPQGNELRYDSLSGDISIDPLPEALKNKEALSDGKLVFSNATLEEILRTVARTRGMEISIPAGLGGQTQYEVKFTDDESIDEILDVLKLLTDGFDYKLQDNGFIRIE